MDIFGLQQSKADLDFIKTNANLEFEVAADIIETCQNLPYIGSLFKLGKVAVNYMDWNFIRKLGKFLNESAQISEEKKEKFINNLDKGDYKRIYEYMSHLLYTAEEDGKAVLMGKIYKTRLLDAIDNDMMLRLCSIVNKSFLQDLQYLERYTVVCEDADYITDNLNALGLLKDEGNMYETDSEDGWTRTGFGSTKHSLNEIGRRLFEIIIQ